MLQFSNIILVFVDCKVDEGALSDIRKSHAKGREPLNCHTPKQERTRRKIPPFV